MSLITCPECRVEVSDRALACPKCGFPVAEHCFDQNALVAEEVSDPEHVDQLLAQILDKNHEEDSVDLRIGRVIKTRVIIDSKNVSFGRKSMPCKSITGLVWWSQTTKNIE